MTSQPIQPIYHSRFFVPVGHKTNTSIYLRAYCVKNYKYALKYKRHYIVHILRLILARKTTYFILGRKSETQI